MKTQWKEHVEKLAEKVGKIEARRLLVIEGIAPVTAERIIGDRYQSQPRTLVLEAIKRALMAAEGKAS